VLRRGGRLGSVAVGLALAILVPALPASAQHGGDDSTARGLFQAGKSAFEAGEYDAALRYFEESFARSGRPQLKYNIGLAADRLRQDAKAVEAFRAYLREVPQAENRGEVESRIRAIDKAQSERDRLAPVVAPVAVAQAQPEEDPTRSQRDDTAATDTDDPSLTSQWWFWTGVAAVVVGGTIVAIAVASGGDEREQPIGSSSGITVMTLRAR
jgi:tetratricopeptide (TPR) repeat protein